VRGPTVPPRPKGHWIAQTSGRIRARSVQPRCTPCVDHRAQRGFGEIAGKARRRFGYFHTGIANEPRSISIRPATHRRPVWSLSVAAIGSAIRATSLPCWSREWPRWSVAIPDYSPAPEATLTETVQEISLAANGPSRGIAGAVVLSGWSAGAHLTALALDHPLVAAGFCGIRCL
jgi:hypothetical protein